MKNKSFVFVSRVLVMTSVVALAACAGNNQSGEYAPVATPTVDYVESLDVYSAPHKDSFLNQLAMNYRSYAIYNAGTSGYPDIGEYFAQKAVAAFSGELPYPEMLDNWPVEDEQASFELHNAYNELLDQLINDASMTQPQLAAEAQAKYDCWLTAAASGQTGTAEECRGRFYKTMQALENNSGTVISNTVTTQDGVSQITTETTQTTMTATGDVLVAVERDTVTPKVQKKQTQEYYPDTRNLSAMRGSKAREGVIIVNNVNVPEHLINPEPVQPLVFNQNIYGGDKTISDSNNVNDNSVRRCVHKDDTNCVPVAAETAVDGGGVEEAQVMDVQTEQIPQVSDELVTREEFINMMMAMRAELMAINQRLDQLAAANANAQKSYEKTFIKVQQIPLEPKQRVMEEVFEILFDFDKATIKPEYEQLIKQLASATQESKNIKVSVIGHTDTMGTNDYNYALGGRRADAVQKMLIKYGIPASQIVAVSAGEEDLAVQTGDGVANAANRRVQVIKEVHYTEKPQKPITVVEEYVMPDQTEVCGMYGCSE